MRADVSTAIDPVAQCHRRAIEQYIAAKDFNQPYRMADAFAEDATLAMVVDTDAISFPAASIGLDAITDVLVRRFAQSYENVHTFCITEPPGDAVPALTCDWLVGMSEKDSGKVRVGCGRYEWRFQPQSPRRVQQLTINIRHMEFLSPVHLRPIMRWLSSLPYPWCDCVAAFKAAPPLDELMPIRAYLLEGK